MRTKYRILASALLVAIAARTCPQSSQEAHNPRSETVSPDLKIPEFDAVSIKLHKADSIGMQMQFTADSYLMNNVSLFTLISDYYDVKSNEIVGGPSWIKSAGFDIEAKVAAGDIETVKQLRPELQRAMMIKVLSDRFALKVHTENRNTSVYELEVAKSGTKLKASNGVTSGAEGQSNPGDSTRFGRGEIFGLNLPMSAFGIMLASVLNQEVVDKTGLPGRYDIALKWNPEDALSVPSGSFQEPSLGEGPSLFTALREQLGLRLKSTKTSVAVLVVDHAEMPIGN